MKLTPEEKELLESVASGEWRSVPDAANRAKQYQEYAKATFRGLGKLLKSTPKVKCTHEGSDFCM